MSIRALQPGERPFDEQPVTLAEADTAVLDAVLAIGRKMYDMGARDDTLWRGVKFALARVGVIFPDDSLLSGLLMAALDRLIVGERQQVHAAALADAALPDAAERAYQRGVAR